MAQQNIANAQNALTLPNPKRLDIMGQHHSFDGLRPMDNGDGYKIDLV
jgi:hypothetical protein